MDAEALARLKLSLTPGVGPRTARALLEAFGTAEQTLAASMAEWRGIDGIGPETARALLTFRDGPAASDELDRCTRQAVSLISSSDADYPQLLAEITDPPLILYARGTFQPSDNLAIGIVGTRHASRYGIDQTERLATSLSRVGLTIVSGLARGIDAMAHRAALAAGGRTLAVLAGGLGAIYPPEHADLASQISANGALLSEVPLDTRPRRGCFPRRNRLISGMCLGVLVVEATERSGALITARHAMEQGRDVFAVPGPVDTRTSRGCHALIRDGAKLVESVDDLLDELGPLMNPVPTSDGDVVRDGRELALNPQEKLILQSLAAEITPVEQIVSTSGLPVQRVLATLTVLESRHLIRRISGDRVARR